MAFVDGLGYARWGARGMPAADAVVGFTGGAILLAFFLLRKRTPNQSGALNIAAIQDKAL